MLYNLTVFSMVLGFLLLVQVLIVTVTLKEKEHGDGSAMFFYVLTSVVSLLGYIGIYVNLAWLSAVN